jgi:hypothetical protein
MSSPFGMGRSSSSRINGGSKTERKMLIKQNTQISLVYLKKICRSKSDEKFKEFLNILNKVDNGSQMIRVKECVKKLIQSENSKGSVERDSNRFNSSKTSISVNSQYPKVIQPHLLASEKSSKSKVQEVFNPQYREAKLIGTIQNRELESGDLKRPRDEAQSSKSRVQTSLKVHENTDLEQSKMFSKEQPAAGRLSHSPSPSGTSKTHASKIIDNIKTSETGGNG